MFFAGQLRYHAPFFQNISLIEDIYSIDTEFAAEAILNQLRSS